MARTRFIDDTEEKIIYPSVSFQSGELVIPAGYEEYYTGIWKWKLNMGIAIEKPKFDYLVRYEQGNGVITHRRLLNGALTAIPESRKSNRN